MKKVVIAQDIVEFVIGHYNSGVPVKQLMEKHGLRRHLIYRILKENRDRVNYRRTDLSAGENLREKSRKLVKDRWKDGLSPEEIAADCDVSLTYVYELLREIGVDTYSRRRKFSLQPYGVNVPSDIWAAEFRGLFFADGVATFKYHHKSKAPTPSLQISLRADNRSLLEEIEFVLGGTIYDIPVPSHPSVLPNAAPQVRWRISGWSRVYSVILSTGLDNALLPAKKREDIEILLETILARLDMPIKYSGEDRARLDEYVERLKQVKKFQL